MPVVVFNGLVGSGARWAVGVGVPAYMYSFVLVDSNGAQVGPTTNGIMNVIVYD